jgi:23S rRNA (cytosine1962-C5)-methyltransferase
MLKICAQILEAKPAFFIINLYSMGFSALILENLIKSAFPDQLNYELGELYLEDRFNKKLPLGVFCRF